MHNKNYYSIRAIKQLLIAKEVFKESEVETAIQELTQLDFEEDKKFVADLYSS